MRSAFALLLIASALVAAPVPKELRKPPPTLVGTWELVSIQFGTTISPRKDITWTFTQNTFQISGSQPEPFAVDSLALPKQIRLRRDNPQTSAVDLVGDNLIIAIPNTPGERLTDTSPGPGVWRCTLRRMSGK